LRKDSILDRKRGFIGGERPRYTAFRGSEAVGLPLGRYRRKRTLHAGKLSRSGKREDIFSPETTGSRIKTRADRAVSGEDTGAGVEAFLVRLGSNRCWKESREVGAGSSRAPPFRLTV